MKSKNMSFVLSGLFLAIFCLLIIIVKTVDVAAIGPEGTSIGLSHLNGAIHNFFGINNLWKAISEAALVLALCLVAEYAIIGLLEWITRKSLAKVDKYLFCLGGLYAVLGILYVFFEKVIINYRPIIEEGAEHVEASFPSTHTMLIVTILGSVIIINKRYGQISQRPRAPWMNMLMQAFLALLIVLSVIGRLVCGVHWFTDILGGVLLSTALLFALAGCLDIFASKEK